jgi:type IV pilus assembly protein PilO
MELINKYRSAIMLGMVVLFLLLFAFYILGLQPTNAEIKDQEAEITRIDGLNTLIQGKVDEIKDAKDNNEALQEEVAQSLPAGDYTNQLILDLKGIGESTYAQVRDVEFTLSEGDQAGQSSGGLGAGFENVKEVKMSARVEGGYTEIRQWMKQLQQLPRLVSIDSFSFSQPYEQRNPGSILQANVAFTAYYYLQ